jgi:Fe-S-cluster containining protein
LLQARVVWPHQEKILQIKDPRNGFASEPRAGELTRPEGSDARVVIRVNGKPVAIEARVPGGSVRLDELLPALHKIDDRLIEAAIAGVEARGERVSCAKGCSACCRAQPVPITPPEALALSRLVERLPEPRRSAVRSAFATAVERLRAADLYNAYMRREPNLTREGARAVARRYIALALTCPFLEQDVCSIYNDRPFVCRQYHVTSPPDLCTEPLDKPVKPVDMPATFATAMLAASESISGRKQYTIPLVLALEYAAANDIELTQTCDARTTFKRVVYSLKR